MKNCILILLILVMFGCGNRHIKNAPNTSPAIDSTIEQKPILSQTISIPAFCDQLKSLIEYDPIDSLYTDWKQIINHYRKRIYPQGEHLFLALNEDYSVCFDLFQEPRYDDIHYIDTLLCALYLTTADFGPSTPFLSNAFNCEFEKFISLPITFQKTLPLFENGQGNRHEGRLWDKSSNGIYVHTPDREHKIYSYDDNTGGVGRNYRTYVQYLSNGKVRWQKLEDDRPQIHKIYTFSINRKTYYAVISFQRHYTSGWAEYFEIVTIENGKFVPHPEFYPPNIQNHLYTIYDRKKRQKELKAIIPDADELFLKDIMDEEELEPMEQFRLNSSAFQNPNMIEFYNLGIPDIDIEIDFDPRTLCVSYNDIVYGGENVFATTCRKSFMLKVPDVSAKI